MTSRPARRAAVLIAAAVALVLSGCAAESKDASDNASAADGAAAPPAGKIAPGVTEDSIKVGIVYPDHEAVKKYVKIDHGDYEATYNAVIQRINDAGGINGRKIVPVFGKVNIASPAAAQETCVKLTQDEKVFAVVGTLNANEPLCYVQTNKTAVVGGPLTAKNYALAQAPWFGIERGGDEITDSMGLFTADNTLAGKKVAVVGEVKEQSLITEIVLPALRKNGVTPVETGIMDASLRDAAAVSQQLGVFIQKFRSAGADTVVVVGGMGGEFPKQLEKTDYRPRLLFTNNSTPATYTRDAAPHDYDSVLNNALALDYNTQWSEPTMQACVLDIEARIPALKGKLTIDRDTLPAGEPTPQSSADAACRYMALFQAIADKAGRDLTYETFQNAGFTLGPLQIPGIGDKADYTRQTPHGALPVRLARYNPDQNKIVIPAS